MYTKDKNLRITFRCDDKLGEWVTSQSTLLGVTPSAFVRQSLFSMMANQVRLSSLMEQTFISSAKAVNFNEHHIDNQ